MIICVYGDIGWLCEQHFKQKGYFRVFSWNKSWENKGNKVMKNEGKNMNRI